MASEGRGKHRTGLPLDLSNERVQLWLFEHGMPLLDLALIVPDEVIETTWVCHGRMFRYKEIPEPGQGEPIVPPLCETCGSPMRIESSSIKRRRDIKRRSGADGQQQPRE